MGNLGEGEGFGKRHEIIQYQQKRTSRDGSEGDGHISRFVLGKAISLWSCAYKCYVVDAARPVAGCA